LIKGSESGLHEWALMVEFPPSIAMP